MWWVVEGLEMKRHPRAQLRNWARGTCKSQLPVVIVPRLAAAVVPTIAVAFAVPNPTGASRPVRSAFEAPVASLVRPLVIDPATVSACRLEQRWNGCRRAARQGCGGDRYSRSDYSDDDSGAQGRNEKLLVHLELQFKPLNRTTENVGLWEPKSRQFVP